MEVVPEEVLRRRVTGVNIAPGSLADQLGDRPTLLVFLRHFGCLFCREAISDLRAAAEKAETYPDVLFFAQASSTECRSFLRLYWPDARAIADPDLELYDAFGIGRGGLLQSFGPSALMAHRRASAKGHESGPRSGDIWRLPGALVLQGDRVLWRYTPRHAGDHPDFDAIPRQLAALAAE